MKIVNRSRFTLALLLLMMTAGCAARNVVRAAYCDQRKPDGSCAVWAKHPYPCVYNQQTGGCTASTR
jgi:hypothetical protein